MTISSTSFPDQVAYLQERLEVLEQKFSGLNMDTKNIVTSEVKKRWKEEPQATTMFGLTFAMCVDTKDPWKQNGVRWYSPLLIEPSTPISALPWAYPISSMGGFDDCGLNWVPPAGSTLAILFEQGSRDSAFYLGTTWHRNRGPEGQHNWGYNIQEFYDIYDGHRKGYLVGANDESQVFPPHNTENYNGPDIDSQSEFDSTPDIQDIMTSANIYSFKTPEKHGIKLVDGDPRCGRHWKRFEMQSSCGNFFIMKDDHIHPSGQWAHPSCGCGGGDLSHCSQDTTSEDCQDPSMKPKCANPFFKDQNECRPVQGPGTPQNNKLSLDQSGMQLLSISGHSMVLDDSVEQPQGLPLWERSIQDFDFGCTDKYTGSFYFKSATGHAIIMSDIESDSQLRGDKNYIRLLSASGNKVELNDHTTGAPDCPGCPPNLAGEKRGILLQSTSNHIIQMCDNGNQQCSPCRMEGGDPINMADNAFILIRSGYGLEMTFHDDNSQQNTQQQYIRILAPQKDNPTRGQHIELFQEAADGPGLIFLRAGGNYVIETYDNMLTQVGDPDKNPSNKLTFVSKDYYIQTKQLYLVRANRQEFQSETQILLVGECNRTDCGPDPTTGKSGPCIYNVVINRCPVQCPLTGYWHFQPGKSTSESVFASGHAGCGG